MWLFGILRRLFTLPAGYAESGKTLGELRPQYRKWELLALPILFCVTPPLTLAWWWIIELVGDMFAGWFSEAVFQLRMSGFVWLMPAFILGILTTGLLLDLFYHWRLKDRYPEYIRYMNLHHSYDNKAASGPLVLFFLFLVLLVLTPLLHWRAVFREEEMVIYPFFSVSSVRHSYKDIVEIKTAPQVVAPNGNVVVNKDKDHIVRFSNGYKWSTKYIWGLTSDWEKDRLIEFLSQKSGVPVRKAAVLE